MTDEAAIRHLIERWQEATQAGDLEGVLALLSEDCVFLTPGQAPMTRAAFSQGFAALEGFKLVTRSEIRDLYFSGDLAYCWSDLEVHMTPRAGGDTLTRSGPVLSIFRKQNGAWQLTRDANLLTLDVDTKQPVQPN